MAEKSKIEVSKKIENYTAYMFEHAMLTYMPSREFLKHHLKKETIHKYDEFMDALYNEVGHLECNECIDDYIIEYGYNYTDK